MGRWSRRIAFALGALLATFCVAALLRLPVCLPFDLVWNLAPAVDAPELRPGLRLGTRQAGAYLGSQGSHNVIAPVP